LCSFPRPACGSHRDPRPSASMARSVVDIATVPCGGDGDPLIPPAMRRRHPPRLCHAPHWTTLSRKGRAVLEAAADRSPAADGRNPRDPSCRASAPEGDDNQHALGSFEGRATPCPERYRHEALLSARLRDGKIAHGRELSLERFATPAQEPEGARGGARVVGRLRCDFDPAGSGPGPARARIDRVGRSSTLLTRSTCRLDTPAGPSRTACRWGQLVAAGTTCPRCSKSASG